MTTDNTTAQALRVRYGHWCKQHDFAAGDLVVWKPGLKNAPGPDYMVPMLVLKVLVPDAMHQGYNRSTEGYYNEKADLVVGLYNPDDGEMLTYGMSSDRVEPYKTEGQKLAGTVLAQMQRDK